MRALSTIALLSALASCAGHSPSVATPARTEAPALEPPETPLALPGCAPTLVAEGPFFRWRFPLVRATGSSFVADRQVVGRGDADPVSARHAFGAPVVALAAQRGGVRVVTSDGGVFALDSLEAAPRRIGQLETSAYSIARAPAGVLVVRDDARYGTLLTVDREGHATPLPGLPPSTVHDAVFFDRRRAVVLLAGGVAGVWRQGTFAVVPTERPVRTLLVEANGVLGELAPGQRRTDFSRPPVVERVSLARGSLGPRPRADDPSEASCVSSRFGPECDLEVCEGRRVALVCSSVRAPVANIPGDGFVHPIPLGDGRRFVLEAMGSVFLATRGEEGFSFAELAAPRHWSREVAAAHGEWLHLRSTRDHHAPHETDVLWNLGTSEAVDLGAFRGRERSRLLSGGTVMVVRLAHGEPRVEMGTAPGPFAAVATPEGALDADFLDPQRGVAIADDGSSISFTCDGGSHWTRVPFDGGERLRVELPPESGDHASPPLVRCADERCVLALDVPLALDFDPAHAAAAPRPIAPLRVRARPSPSEPVVRLRCEHPARRRWYRPRTHPSLVRDGEECSFRWTGSDEGGPYRASSGRLPCADIPAEGQRNVRGSVREGLLVEDRRPHGRPLWIATDGGMTRLEHLGSVRSMAIPGGRAFEYAQMQYGPIRAAVLGRPGVVGELSVDFFPHDVTVGWTSIGDTLSVVALAGSSGEAQRGFRFDMRAGATPTALPRISFQLCDDDRPVGPLARVPSPPIYFEGDDSPYAYAAELDLGEPATCVRRVFTGQGALSAQRGRLVARGFVCTPY